MNLYSMTLKEAIHYADKCLICKSDLIYDPIFYTIDETDNGIVINEKADNIQSNFNFDGSFDCPFDTVTYIIYKICPVCVADDFSLSIRNIKKNQFLYSISLGVFNNKYYCKLDLVLIKYNKDNYIYSLYSTPEKSSIYYGCLTSKIRDIFHADINPVDISKYNDIDQVLNKIQIYNILS